MQFFSPDCLSPFSIHLTSRRTVSLSRSFLKIRTPFRARIHKQHESLLSMFSSLETMHTIKIKSWVCSKLKYNQLIHLLLGLATYSLLFPRNKYKGKEKFNKKRGVFTEEGGNLRGNLFLAWQYCTSITLLLYSSDCHLKILTRKSMKAQLCEAPWKFQHRQCPLGIPSIQLRPQARHDARLVPPLRSTQNSVSFR